MSIQGRWSKPRRFRTVATTVLVVLLAAPIIAISVRTHTAGAADFSVGDTVVVDTDRLNLRTEAGTSADVVEVLDNGVAAVVTDGPVDADGYSWYELDAETGSSGWAAGDFLALKGADDPGFSEGDSVVVVDGSLNLREAAGLSATVLDVLPDGTAATVLSGPVTADGLPWYEIDTEDYGQGWSAGGFLAFSDQPSGDTFTIGEALIVQTDTTLNLRDGASLDSAVIDKLENGARVVVVDGPVTADGFDWYQLDTSLGTGWSAGEFLATPADAIGVGDEVKVVDGTLNLRSDASIDADVLDQLPDGTLLDVTDGPVAADGYTWFQVESSDFDPGWVAGEYLEIVSPASAPAPTSTATSTATATPTPTATATP